MGERDCRVPRPSGRGNPLPAGGATPVRGARLMPAKAVKKAATPSLYQMVDQEFYAEVARENGGKLPADLTDANGKPRKLTMSAKDRAYRQKWNAIAAQERKSK